MSTPIPPSNGLFVDTAGWAGIVLSNSIDFQTMEAFYKRTIATNRGLVTTNYVLTELVALLTARSRIARTQVIAYINSIRRISQLSIVHIDPTLDGEAWELLEQHVDKAWSLVDAASFVVMRHLGLREAFTSDQHFIQAGFGRLP